MDKVYSPRYYGKKSIDTHVGRWVLSMLPVDIDGLYCEPYAGMLGVLINRPKSAIEIANDLHGRVTNWWKVVRDYTDEFLHRLTFTPWSESFLMECNKLIDEGSEVDRALRYFVLVAFSRNHSDRRGKAHFALSVNSLGSSPRHTERMMAGIHDLADRIRNVQFLNRPAVDILRRLESTKHAVIYCDPPYINARTDTYHVVQHDFEETIDTLKRQKGRVAISGYDDQWDELDWERHELAVKSFMANDIDEERKNRVEVLWTNYKPEKQESLI